MSEPSGRQHPLIAAVRGEQFKPTVILLSGSLLLIAWKYLCSPEFYAEHLAGVLDIGLAPAAAGAVYSFVGCFVMMGLVPLLVVKFVFREYLADYGVQLGDRVRTLRSFLILAPVFLLAAYIGSGDPVVRAEYPVNKLACTSGGMFAFHAATYFLYYLGWEFYFRGFMQMGLRDAVGEANALLIQVMASTLLHIGKPGAETFGAVFGGILWGILVYRTRSLLSGVLQHFLLGITLDWLICFG
jgi:membrane protease YdiL (CAAX protease family)